MLKVGEQVLGEAEGGKAGNYGGNGGDGYSGGGAYGGLGGMDGGDGEDGYNGDRGGRGSGQDLEMMVMENFVLTAGIGGNATGGGGGGGGGVLVNGAGPDSGLGVRQGFGGGGSQSANTAAIEGCVLFELM